MTDLLAVEGLCAGYGEARVILNLDLKLGEGRSLAVLGRNGAGKTTLINSLIGVTTRHAGRIFFAGTNLAEMAPHRRARAGLGWVPQERNIFRSLSVEENLSAVSAPGAWTLERVYSLFPRLKERRRNGGGQLSGGEQQMLAIARALIRSPKLILLDEPFEGLAPVIVHDLIAVCRKLADEGQTIVLVEQNLAATLGLAHRAYLLSNGHIVHEGPASEIKADPEFLQKHLGV